MSKFWKTKNRCICTEDSVNFNFLNFSASKKRRFVIRQRLLPGSTASLASTATPQSQPSTNSQPPKRPDMFLRPGSPKAPMVEFGEDDSPRIQEMPPMPKKK